MNNSMINPPIMELLERVTNKYSLVTIASKRARQLIDGKKPLVEIDSTKPVTLATEEIFENKLNIEYPKLESHGLTK